MPFDINSLLDRPYPENYENDWLIFARSSDAYPGPFFKILVFRVGEDWLGLESKVLGAVTEMRPIHLIPFFRHSIRGITNIRGDLKPVIDMEFLTESKLLRREERKERFMVLISQESEEWVFTIDAVLGIFEIAAKDLQNVPVNIAKSYGNLVKGIVNIERRIVAILEEELLFYTLEHILKTPHLLNLH